MARLVVTEVLNPHNGLSVDLQFDRAPEGTLQVYVARMPRETGLPAASVQPVQGAANRYRVVHPYPQPVDRESELMYFTAVDDQGASVWEDEAGYLHGQAAAWIGSAAEAPSKLRSDPADNAAALLKNCLRLKLISQLPRIA